MLELGLCMSVAAGGVLMLWHAVMGIRAWRRAHRRPRLRLVVPAAPRYGWFRGGAAAAHSVGAPLPRRTAHRRRRVDVSYLRCISGGGHASASPVETPSSRRADGQEDAQGASVRWLPIRGVDLR